MRTTRRRDLGQSVALSSALTITAGVVGPCVADAATLTMRVSAAADVRLDDAVVYAVPEVASKRAPAAAEVSQVARQFKPTVTVVQTGAPVTFPNRDTVRHQIYSFSPAKIFELKLYSGMPSEAIVFDKPGVVVLGCNIHDAMVAYIVVVDTPYFGKTGPDGVVRIDLPAGTYALSVWHPRAASQAAPRTVPIAGDVRLETVVGLGP